MKYFDPSIRHSLLRALTQGAYEYQNEPFTLKSGKTSHHYVDCRKILLQPMYRVMAAELVAARFVVEGLVPDIVAGVALGGIPLADEVSGMLRIPAAYVRPEPKAHGKGNQVESPLRAGRAVLLEDVTTTGGSTCKAIKALREARLEPMGVVILVDREDGAVERIWEEAGVQAQPIFTLSEITRAYEAQARQGHP